MTDGARSHLRIKILILVTDGARIFPAAYDALMDFLGYNPSVYSFPVREGRVNSCLSHKLISLARLPSDIHNPMQRCSFYLQPLLCIHCSCIYQLYVSPSHGTIEQKVLILSILYMKEMHFFFILKFPSLISPGMVFFLSFLNLCCSTSQ